MMSTDPWLSAAAQLHRGTAPLHAPAPTLAVLPPPPTTAPPTETPPQVPTPLGVTVWVHGVSGGCGETRIAQLSPEWVDGHHGWPSSPAPVLLVARTSADSLTAAHAAIAQWARGELPITELAGIVLVADAPGRLPPPLVQLRRHVVAGAPRHWDIGWTAAWRLGDPDAVAPGCERLLKDLAAARHL